MDVRSALNAAPGADACTTAAYPADRQNGRETAFELPIRAIHAVKPDGVPWSALPCLAGRIDQVSLLLGQLRIEKLEALLAEDDAPVP